VRGDEKALFFPLAIWPRMALSAYVATTGLTGQLQSLVAGTGQCFFSVARGGRFRAQLQVQLIFCLRNSSILFNRSGHGVGGTMIEIGF
jgi:hypothetical protein